jgi:hypothetical protein
MIKSASVLLVLLVATAPAFAQTNSTEQNDNPKPTILPDSPFYGLKLAIENIQTAFTFNDTEKAKFEVKLAQERLAEIKSMLDKRDNNDARKAKNIHDDEIEDVEKIADKQDNSTHGQKVKTYVHELVAEHEKKLGRFVSEFASENSHSNKTHTSDRVLSDMKDKMEKIRKNHNDEEKSDRSD